MALSTNDPAHPVESARLNRLLRGLDPETNTTLPSFKRGGKIKKTGPVKLHKGERVITAAAAKKMDKKGMKAAPARRGRARKR